jgi:DNA-binding transcriptional MocR family regulator
MDDPSDRDRWQEDRTTFQRVYDVVLGTQEYQSATAFADRAGCSETAARRALEQLAEMGIADRREGRPATYRRNEAYLTWKRVESLAREHGSETLRTRLDELVAEDQEFQREFGVPDPDAVTVADVPVEDHGAAEQRWQSLSEWRTVRRDIRVLRRAVQRAEAGVDDGAPA